MALANFAIPTYAVNTPPLTPEKWQGMRISLMPHEERFCAFVPFADGLLECGVFVNGTTDSLGRVSVKKPTASGAKILGFTTINFQRLLLWDNPLKVFKYQDDQEVTLLQKGDSVAYAEAPVDLGDTVWYRHTVDAALTRIGAIAPATGTGLALVPGCRVLEKKSSPGLVRISINLYQ